MTSEKQEKHSILFTTDNGERAWSYQLDGDAIIEETWLVADGPVSHSAGTLYEGDGAGRIWKALLRAHRASVRERS